MVVCVPIDEQGGIDPRWGRAERVAVAQVEGGAIQDWTEFEVGWDRLHDAGGEGEHHARIALFLREHSVEAVVAGHMGPPMQHMLEKMRIHVRLGAEGAAREAVLGAA